VYKFKGTAHIGMLEKWMMKRMFVRKRERSNSRRGKLQKKGAA
jgi:hypothetical protein